LKRGWTTSGCPRTKRRPAPAGSEPGRERERSGDADRDEDGAYAERDELVAEPGRVALLREAVAAPPPVTGARERDDGEPGGADGDEAEPEPGANAPPAEPTRERPRLPRDEDHHGELERGRDGPERARERPEVVGTRKLGRGKVGARVDLREVEIRHLGLPEQRPGDDPDGDQSRGSEQAGGRSPHFGQFSRLATPSPGAERPLSSRHRARRGDLGHPR